MRVLEFSIRETSSLPVEVSAIYTFERPIPLPQALENRPRTPFSFQRFLIPELCGFSGRAIYLDADMQVFEDIAGLWNQPFSDNDLQTVLAPGDARRLQFSVMLLDCERLNWKIENIVAELDSGKLDYASLMFDMRVAKKIGRTIPYVWNSLERFVPNETALLHYTDMNTQPWISATNPNGHLWVACLRRALKAGFINRFDILREVADGHVRPSLVYQLDSGVDNVKDLPLKILLQDLKFSPPFLDLKAAGVGRIYSLFYNFIELIKCCFLQSPVRRLFRF